MNVLMVFYFVVIGVVLFALAIVLGKLFRSYYGYSRMIYSVLGIIYLGVILYTFYPSLVEVILIVVAVVIFCLAVFSIMSAKRSISRGDGSIRK